MKILMEAGFRRLGIMQDGMFSRGRTVELCVLCPNVEFRAAIEAAGFAAQKMDPRDESCTDKHLGTLQSSLAATKLFRRRTSR